MPRHRTGGGHAAPRLDQSPPCAAPVHSPNRFPFPFVPFPFVPFPVSFRCLCSLRRPSPSLFPTSGLFWSGVVRAGPPTRWWYDGGTHTGPWRTVPHMNGRCPSARQACRPPPPAHAIWFALCRGCTAIDCHCSLSRQRLVCDVPNVRFGFAVLPLRPPTLRDSAVMPPLGGTHVSLRVSTSYPDLMREGASAHPPSPPLPQTPPQRKLSNRTFEGQRGAGGSPKGMDTHRPLQCMGRSHGSPGPPPHTT